MNQSESPPARPWWQRESCLTRSVRALIGLGKTAAPCAVIFACACGSLFQTTNPVQLAEELTQQGQYEEAISQYKDHIGSRLMVTGRPEWENPYFYLLRIGDLHLRLEQPQAALEAYQQAEQNSVDINLISDRYRALANWYIERQQLEAAFELLKNHRDRDSLLFDAMLDRVGRAITSQEMPPTATKK